MLYILPTSLRAVTRFREVWGATALHDNTYPTVWGATALHDNKLGFEHASFGLWNWTYVPLIAYLT